MDEAEGLSEENRALVERDGGLGRNVTDDAIEEGFAVEILNRLLNAARAESRSTPDREGVEKVVSEAVSRARNLRCYPGVERQSQAAAIVKDATDAILAVARPASSAGGGLEALRPYLRDDGAVWLVLNGIPLGDALRAALTSKGD